MFPGRLSPTRLDWRIDTVEDLSLKERTELKISKEIKITSRYADSVFECLARIEENSDVNGLEDISVNNSLDSISNEYIERSMGNEEMINQGMKDVSDENVNGISNGTINYNVSNKLEIVPTFFENGNEVVVFDEELDKERGKLEIKDIVSDDNNMFFFKFKHEDGINIVLEQSPWVLVEIDAAKGYTNKIEIIYIDAEKNEKSDNVDVEYLYKKHGENCSNNAAQNSTNGSKKEISPNQSMWRFDKGILENLKRSANKFVVL
ncbi:hypothetical protein Tco_1217257 [Tanacetum coccineum]